MPALQVRNFPDDLYEELKAYAASQHRSIAQQTVVAVEQMLQAARREADVDGPRGSLRRDEGLSSDAGREAPRASSVDAPRG